MPDPIAASYSVLAVIQALYHRRRTGKGQHIELAMSETLQSLLADAVVEYTMLGREPERLGNRHRGKAPHGIYRTRGDDTWMAISVATNEEWQALCRELARPELIADPRFADITSRRTNAEALDTIISEWTRERDPWETTRILQAAEITAGPTYNARDILTNEHLRSRGFIVEDDHPQAGQHTMTGVPWHFHNQPPPTYRHAPLLGADNEYVFKEILGLSQPEIERLTETQVIY